MTWYMLKAANFGKLRLEMEGQPVLVDRLIRRIRVHLNGIQKFRNHQVRFIVVTSYPCTPHDRVPWSLD
jgi:hypothetical protein